MPAYNEQDRIVKTLENFRKTIIKKYKHDIEILIVSESIDHTNDMVLKYAFRHKQVRLLASRKRAGKGKALIKGFAVACSANKWDIIGFTDADLSVSGDEVMRLIEKLRKDKSIDGVISSRYVKGSKIVGKQKLSRYIASRLYNLMLKALFNFKYNDTQCGAKFFRSSALCSILRPLSLTDMSFDLDLLYEMRLHGYNVVEMPVTYNMIYEGSKLRLKRHVPQMFIVALNYRIEHSAFNRLMPRRLKVFVYNLIKG